MAETLKELIINEIKENLSISITEEYESDYGKSYKVIEVSLFYDEEKLSSQTFTINP